MDERTHPIEINVKYRSEKAFSVTSLVQIISLNYEINYEDSMGKATNIWSVAKVVSVQYGLFQQFDPNLVIWNTTFWYITKEEAVWFQSEEVKIQFNQSNIKNISWSYPYIKFKDFNQIVIKGITELKSRQPKFEETVASIQKNLERNDYIVVFDCTLTNSLDSDVFSVKYSR